MKERNNSGLAKPKDAIKVSGTTLAGEIMALPKWFKKTKPRQTVAYDYSNQLDLFSQADQDTPAPVESTAARISEGTHGKPRPPQQLDFGTLEPLPPFDAGATKAAEPASGGTGEDGAAVRGPAVRIGLGEKDGASPGLGTGGAPVSSGAFVDEPEREPSHDFRITDSHKIGVGGAHEKAKDNIAAIRLLKTLEAENREADAGEKAVLARYVGWGGMPNVFSHYPPQEWRATADTVRTLLDDEEYASVRASTPNAHFTSPMVISAIWKALDRMGVRGESEVLEPAMGVGHFLGLQPEGITGHRTGVELDSVSARIAKKLYPDSSILHRGFEETKLPDNYFDVVVGNVPFG